MTETREYFIESYCPEYGETVFELSAYSDEELEILKENGNLPDSIKDLEGALLSDLEWENIGLILSYIISNSDDFYSEFESEIMERCDGSGMSKRYVGIAVNMSSYKDMVSDILECCDVDPSKYPFIEVLEIADFLMHINEYSSIKYIAE